MSALEERLEVMEKLLLKIDARDRMRKVRAAREEPAEPNPYTDPEGWKAHMRAQRAKEN